MKQSKWDAMSGEEKFEYLNSSTAEVKTQTVMNGMARAIRTKPLKTLYTVTRGRVLTGEGYSLDDANAQDKESLEYWKSNT